MQKRPRIVCRHVLQNSFIWVSLLAAKQLGMFINRPLRQSVGSNSQEFQHCHVYLLFHVVWPAFVLLSPLVFTFNSTLDEGLAEAVMPCHMAKTWHLPMLNSSKERFPSVYESFDLALYIITGFVLPLGNMEELSQSLLLKWPDHLFCLNQECPQLDGYGQKFELCMEADVDLPCPCWSGHCCCGCGDPCVNFCVADAIFW